MFAYGGLDGHNDHYDHHDAYCQEDMYHGDSDHDDKHSETNVLFCLRSLKVLHSRHPFIMSLPLSTLPLGGHNWYNPV